MRKLKDILNATNVIANVDRIMLSIGSHTIDINCDEEGSWFIIRNFQEEKFFVKGIDIDKHNSATLFLSATEE